MTFQQGSRRATATTYVCLLLCVTSSLAQDIPQCENTCDSKGMLPCGTGLRGRPTRVESGGNVWCCPRDVQECTTPFRSLSLSSAEDPPPTVGPTATGAPAAAVASTPEPTPAPIELPSYQDGYRKLFTKHGKGERDHHDHHDHHGHHDHRSRSLATAPYRPIIRDFRNDGDASRNLRTAPYRPIIRDFRNDGDASRNLRGLQAYQCARLCNIKSLMPCGTGLLGRPTRVQVGGNVWCCPRGVQTCW